MKMKLSELLHFHAKQLEATQVADKHRFTLFGGAAGPGKSYWLRWFSIRQLIKWHLKTGLKGIHGALFSEDYPTLKDRQISKMQIEVPPWLGEIKETKADGLALFLRDSFGGGVLALRNLDDPSKYVSSEFALIAVEELTKNPEDVFDRLRSRMRWTGIEDTKFIAATNPGEVGHVWVKKRWIDKEYPIEEQEPEQFAFVPALPKDNPTLAASYIKTLMSLPEKLRKAYLEGNWDIFEGQFFSEFDRAIHVIKPFMPPKDWRRIRCGDYGYAAPSAVYDIAIAPNGDLYVYRELYKKGLTFSQLAKEILATQDKEERFDYSVFDPAIWARNAATGETGSEILSNNGLNVFKGDNDRLNGWGRLREYLRDENGSPHIFFTENCPNLIRTLPALVHDKTRIEDVNSEGEDHAGDACFPESTLIATENGYKRIVDIKIDDLVWTRYGLKPVEAVFYTGERETVEVDFNDGSTLVGTPTHPLWVDGEGFKPLSDIKCGDMSWTCTQTNTAESLENYGSRPMGQFRQSTTSTTKTGIKLITLLKTLSAWKGGRILVSICSIAQEFLGTVTHAVRSSWHLIGRRVGFVPMFASLAGDVPLSSMMSDVSANAAESLALTSTSQPSPVQEHAQKLGNTFEKNTSLHAFGVASLELQKTVLRYGALTHVVNIRTGQKRRVYNLTVSDVHEYYANNHLVSNCRYGIMTRPKPTVREALPHERFKGMDSHQAWFKQTREHQKKRDTGETNTEVFGSDKREHDPNFY